jgi:hypothetical protein
VWGWAARWDLVRTAAEMVEKVAEKVSTTPLAAS